MAITKDNQFELQASGQADWDSGLNANFTILERGYHQTAVAGMNVNTGFALWQSSAGFWYHFNPNSEDIRPHALAPVAANSGESLQALVFGIVRSLSIHSAVPQGQDVFVSAATPGMLVGSYSAASRPIGRNIVPGIFFNPRKQETELITRTASIAGPVVNTPFFFTLDVGKNVWVRQFQLLSNSADQVSFLWHANSARTVRLYETISGGINTSSGIASDGDRAGFAVFNSDVGTLSGLIYGTILINSGSFVSSSDFNVAIRGYRF